jgi:hypothetical protein
VRAFSSALYVRSLVIVLAFAAVVAAAPAALSFGVACAGAAAWCRWLDLSA